MSDTYLKNLKLFVHQIPTFKNFGTNYPSDEFKKIFRGGDYRVKIELFKNEFFNGMGDYSRMGLWSELQ